MSEPITHSGVQPELLSPAGNWDCVRAAVENGADAVYFGVERFNARLRANNFTESDLPELMRFLRKRGVRGYLTFNTLVFTGELAAAEDCLRAAISAGVDAAIVQDVGIARLIRRLSSDFPIHASTQMTVTSPAGVAFARELGCDLVVLARENSIREIEQIQAEQRTVAAAGGPRPLPLEVFVHGALCVAYSGQCLTSESLGGRSANRGECAQACRMPYQLIADGNPVALEGRQYLLSPQDLSGLEVVPELARVGVASLKIEGRLKSPEYVAAVTKVYRRALDSLAAGPVAAPADAERYELEMSFSRGLHTGWLGGVNNQKLVHARFAKKRGIRLGEIVGARSDAVSVRLERPLRPGDGVVIDDGGGGDDEQGGRVVSVRKNGAISEVCLFRGQLDVRRIGRGAHLWKTSDPALEQQWRATFAPGRIGQRMPLRFELHGVANAPLTLIARDGKGRIARAQSENPLVAATHHPLTLTEARRQLDRLGNSHYRLADFDFQIEGEVLAPWSELNRLRRAVLADLERQLEEPGRWNLATGDIIHPAPPAASPAAETPMTPLLVALVRRMDQLPAAYHSPVEAVYCDFENPKRYREAVEWVREARGARVAGPTLWVAPPRIFKPGEEWVLKLVRSCNADGYLVRNYDHLQFFNGDRRRGDFSLNVANPLAAGHFLERWPLETLTASYDLNIGQLEDLLRATDASRLEITLHQRMPLFHMEHCVFCAFLSQGTDYTNCGRPCDRHEVRLRDRVGQEHPLRADAGCRNTLFNARAQTGAEFAGRLLAAGARRFRVEFLDESPAEVARILDRYGALLRGELAGDQLWRELKLEPRLGVTRGQLDSPNARKPLPVAGRGPQPDAAINRTKTEV